MKHLKTLTAIIVLIILSGCNTFQPRRMPLSNLIENSPFEFVVIGDSRPGERAYPENPASASIQYLNNINWINQINPVFSINIGDLILGYNTVAIGLAEKQWDIFDKTVELYRAPLFMVVGNHDVWDEFSDKLYQKRYGPHYYSWNYGDCSFIALSSEVLGEADKIGPGQRKWLEKTLIKTQKSKFRFVFLHRPVWWNNENGTNLWMEQIHPLLKKYKVDTVFAGHCHHYEPKEIDGIRYIITGGGGAEIGNNEGIGDFFHFLKVTVDENPRPEINVIRENRVLPLDVVKPGLRNTVKGIFDHKTIFTDSSDKTQILLPVNNYMKEKINVNFKLISYENKLFQPTNIIVNLAPGEANTAKFSVAENIKNLELKISVNQQKNVLAENNFMIFLPRKGTYSDKKNQRNELIAKEANQIVFGNQNWLGTNDCSAVAWVTKTETGFVVTVKVTDDILVTKDSKDFWNTDGVELYFDVRPEKTRGKPYLGKGVMQIAVVPSFDKNISPRIEFHPANNHIEIPGLSFKTKLITGGYQIDVFMPLKGFAVNNFIPDDKFHFSYGINDTDKNVRETQMMWSGGEKNYCNPTAYGRLENISN